MAPLAYGRPTFGMFAVTFIAEAKGRVSVKVAWDNRLHTLGVYDTLDEAVDRAKNLRRMASVSQWPMVLQRSRTVYDGFAPLYEASGIDYDPQSKTYIGYALSMDEGLVQTKPYSTRRECSRWLVKLMLNVCPPDMPGQRPLIGGVQERRNGKFVSKLLWNGRTRYVGIFATRDEAQAATDDLWNRMIEEDVPVTTTHPDDIHEIMTPDGPRFLGYAILGGRIMKTLMYHSRDMALEELSTIISEYKQGIMDRRRKLPLVEKKKRELPKHVYRIRNGRYIARVTIGGKRMHLATRGTPEEAAEVVAEYFRNGRKWPLRTAEGPAKGGEVWSRADIIG